MSGELLVGFRYLRSDILGLSAYRCWPQAKQDNSDLSIHSKNAHGNVLG